MQDMKKLEGSRAVWNRRRATELYRWRHSEQWWNERQSQSAAGESNMKAIVKLSRKANNF